MPPAAVYLTYIEPSSPDPAASTIATAGPIKMGTLLFVQLGFLLLALLAYRLYSWSSASLPLPPGPRPVPIVGNINDLPPPGKPEYLHWLKFKDLYGPVSSVTVLGRTFVILHDKKAVHFLLEKNSAVASDRGSQPFADLCGFGEFLSSLQYGDVYRQSRKMIHQQMGSKALAERWSGVQDAESRRLLLRTLQDPSNLINHFKTQSSAIVLKITYGYATEPHTTDPLVDMIEQFMHRISLAYVPLSWAVDLLPWLRYLPGWIPGAGFKTTARVWRQNAEDVADLPYAAVRRQMAKGTHRGSYVSSLVDMYSQSSDGGEGVLRPGDELLIKKTAAIMYGGGSDTTSSIMTVFLLAMVLYPDVQKKAQQEIDNLLGSEGRLPELSDRDQLPYVNALLKECHRWFPIVPMGQCHVTTEELTYEGYRIPKGAFLLTARWWFLHDPQVYRCPSSFDPERYMEPRSEPDPTPDQFGYGRRICPGRFIAPDSLFITMTRMLATFDIDRAVDASGQPLEVEIAGHSGIIDHPRPFPFAVRPRSGEHVELIRSSEALYPWEKGDSDLLGSGPMTV